MDCRSCLEQLHFYLDGELEERTAEEVQLHLDGCTDCFKRSQLEEAFRRTIRSAAAAPAAPPELATRIRRALDREDEVRAAEAARATREPRARAARRWLSRGLAAAAILLAAALGLQLVGLPQADGPGDHGVVHPAFMRGELVCLDCLMKRAGRVASDSQLPKPGIPSEDPNEHHGLHLRCSEGKLWELFVEDEARPQLAGHDNAGREVTLVGTAYPELRVIRVARVNLR